MKLSNIIAQLQEASGSNTKKAILEANKDNMILKEYLRVTYDPRINFFITEKTYTLPTYEASPVDYLQFSEEDIWMFVAVLAERHFTGNEAKNWMRNALTNYTHEDQNLISWMILKDIKAGISVSTINKIWPNLIFEQHYMRCSLPSAVKLSEWDWKNGVYSQVKMDGSYAAVSNKAIITRGGNTYPLDIIPEEFKQEMESLPDNFELNGELTIQKDSITLSRKEGNGMLNSLMQGAPLEEGYELHYTAWDVENYSFPYADRFIDVLASSGEFIRPVEYKMVYSMEEAAQHFQECLSQGLEGTVLKNPKGMWKDGTSKDCVKYKIEAEIDMKVVGIIEGTGKYKGILGALQLESQCGKVKVDCGTGFSDKQRKELFEKQPKVVTIKANDLITKEGSDTFSLFLPVLIEERWDKREADNLERIQETFNSAKGLK